jgi:hypothetical protein
MVFFAQQMINITNNQLNIIKYTEYQILNNEYGIL